MLEPKLSDLEDTEYFDLAEMLGMENFLKLTKFCGKSMLYIPDYEAVIRKARDRSIVSDSKGGFNFRALSHKYGISDQRIRQILKKSE